VSADVTERSYDQHDFYLPTEINPTWLPVEPFYPPAFYKDSNNLVRLRGVAKLVSGSLPSVMFTLPKEMRPVQSLKLRVATLAGSRYQTGLVNITKNGDVIAVEGQMAFSLDSIAFSVPSNMNVLVSGSEVSVSLRFPKPGSTCLKFWEQLWSPKDPTIRACHDPKIDDEVLLTGSAAPPQPDSASGFIGIIDREQRPTKDVRVCAASSRGLVQLHISTSGDLYVKGYKGGNVFLDGVSYLKNQVNNWREIPQWKNGFSEAEAQWFIQEKRFTNLYTTPGFRKDNEGRVFLKGIVAPPRPFNASVPMFVLPDEYKPTETIYRCAVTRRGYVTISVNPQGQVAVESIIGSEFISWLSLDGINFLSGDVNSASVVPKTSLKTFDVDALFTTVEGTYKHGEKVSLKSSAPLRSSSYLGFVGRTPLLATVSSSGEVKAEEFPRVDSDNVLVGSEWKAIEFYPKPGAVLYEVASERPSFMIDRNNNIVLLRGLFPYVTGSVDMFSFPDWVQVEKETVIVATGHKGYYPLLVRTSGQVQWVGPQPETDTLVLLDGLHFSVVAGSEPPMKHLRI
jgi:hypothetical protein